MSSIEIAQFRGYLYFLDSPFLGWVHETRNRETDSFEKFRDCWRQFGFLLVLIYCRPAFSRLGAGSTKRLADSSF